MAKIYSGSANYVPAATTKTIHSKAGKIHGVLITADANGYATFYDNTSGSGTVLLLLYVAAYGSNYISFDNILPLAFTTGLTIVTAANTRVHVITEA